MQARRFFLGLVLAAAITTVAWSGHELPVYPSYYPHEIEIATLPPERAAELLVGNKLHAYVGGEPRFSGAPPETVSPIESLGAFIVVRVNPASTRAQDEPSACALAATVVRALAANSGGLIVHPYPVTPLHGDFLHHVDRVEAARTKFLGDSGQSPAADMANLKVKAGDEFTKTLLPAAWATEGQEWDAEITSVSVSDLLAPERFAINGWLGPPWLRTGWFQSYRLLAGALDDAGKRRAGNMLARLQSGEDAGPAERVNLERDLVASLTAGCRAIVAGYVVKREYFNTEFSAGIENIGFDALDGFNSPNFLRTVKLKDFPWNGWLALALDARPAAAWNPIAGFSDPFGRLVWSAVGDTALVPAPYDSQWMFNRVSDVQAVREKKPE